ncbi:hypothetical protein GS982_01690 [Rhodococcus hoagii]|uniref:Holliday junction resolvase n=1 Tax=Rhodococcus hoagii TaxID=43767 RepID=A0A9Q5EW75_RHOHA|nr:hypothetical protein [Prescottella equi]NKT77310.1 hypothetical protein [Prescottella equi]NKZ81097.1 hypothetical protein [Prescottella equi]
MPNKQKSRGDQFERDVRMLAVMNGFPGAQRTRAGYQRDAGDIHLDPGVGLSPGVIVQCKWVQSPNWSEWDRQLAEQKDESGAEVALIAMKRSRPGKSPLLFAVMPLEDTFTLLRRAGYGTPLEETE